MNKSNKRQNKNKVIESSSDDCDKKWCLFFEPTCNKDSDKVKLIWMADDRHSCKRVLSELCDVEGLDKYKTKRFDDETFDDDIDYVYNFGKDVDLEQVLNIAFNGCPHNGAIGVFSIRPIDNISDVIVSYAEIAEGIV